MIFSMSVFDFDRVKPLEYLGILITHEGSGSILSYLRKKWVVFEFVYVFFNRFLVRFYVYIHNGNLGK